MMEKLEMELGGRKLIIETGRLAKLADGAVTVQYGDTVVLVTVVASREMKEGVDSLPLYVDYREKTYAAGKIPGGFFKREGRPTEKEILTARLIDRPLRPLFPSGFRNEVQITAAVLSTDTDNDPDILAMLGASAALTLSDIPFPKPTGAVRVGRQGGKFIINPTHTQIEEGELDLVVAGTKDGINMVEGEMKNLSEELVQEAFLIGYKAVADIVSQIERLSEAAGKKKKDIPLFKVDEELKGRVEKLAGERIAPPTTPLDKQEKQERQRQLAKDVLAALAPDFPGKEKEIKGILEELEGEEMRKVILEKGRRADGRQPSDVRPISCEVAVLPRTHGSAIFARGQTQSLVTTTLGTSRDEQMLDGLKEKTFKNFMLHYNFPSFSVGEIRPVRGPGRREIGHGALAERALKAVLPPSEKFPYTIRIVSDILESNGSSSMATVCGGSLCLMDAGVPIKSAMAGIAMGLIRGDEKYVLLTDITGSEDHFGDMDFKITGTRQGITAIQMDLKVEGVPPEILKQAFAQAKTALLFILSEMSRALDQPRPSVSKFAPHILIVRVAVSKLGQVIGPGGKMVRSITEKTGAEVNIEDDGEITITAPNEEGARKARKMIEDITAEAEVGKIYLGKVKRIMDFGAFVEVLPGKEGLVHISKLADHHVKRVEDEVKVGDEIRVKVTEIDRMGRINLSRKAAVQEGGAQGKNGEG